MNQPARDLPRDHNLYVAKTFNGREILIPETVDVESDPYLKLDTDESIKNFYLDNGYVVIRGAVPQNLCVHARTAYETEVKGFKRPLYRQTTSGAPERHRFTPGGYMENSILNVHDLRTDWFPGFKSDLMEVLTHQNIQKALRTILGEPGQLVQSMYFEGNPATWPHQDTYYLDSEKIGSMVAVWVAVEDIKPGAGRFYVYPGSHKIDIKKNGGDFDIAFHHDRYKKMTASLIESKQLAPSAPALRQGDALFWNSKTIHGSLPTTQADYSRSSFTAHYIPESHRFLQFQSRIKSFRSRIVNGMRVNHPKDQDLFANRLLLEIESTFPRTFQTMKNIAIKIVTR
jgi:phytanoyl-CoA hydroxylase